MRARILSFAVLLAFAFGLSDVDAQPITLKFSHFLGPTSFFQLDVVEPWAKELEAKTNGKVKVEIHDGTSPLGKVTEQASKAQAGAVDIALGLRGAEGDRFPGSSIIELPFLVPNAALGSHALWTLYKEGALADEYKEYKVLALFVHNPGLIHTTSKRVVTPSDLKGLRLRSPNKTVAAALEHLGAVPVVLQVDDVMPLSTPPSPQPLGHRPARCHPYSGNSILTSSVIFRQRAIWS
jgi:TRAP-type C4-dicarboxylate transport system substrate-binding protein